MFIKKKHDLIGLVPTIVCEIEKKFLDLNHEKYNTNQ